MQYWLEVTLFFVICAPLLLIAFEMKRRGMDQLSDQIKTGLERHNRLQALHEERKKEEKEGSGDV